jgi:hypothetical protein
MYYFGDGFDLYSAVGDAAAGYWDSAVGPAIVPGRFVGSRGLQYGGNTAGLVKSSNSNDSVHHFVFAYDHTTALSGTNIGMYIQISDVGAAQCTVEFRSDGALLLLSGGIGGTVIATWPTAITGINNWNAYEIEVVVHNTAGSISVRKNGNTSNDFTATALNTRGGTANNYANRIQIGAQTAGGPTWIIDDFLWRSDPTAVPWVGDIRCYTRMPASDQSVQFSKNVSTIAVNMGSGSVVGLNANCLQCQRFLTAGGGVLQSATLTPAATSAGHVMAAIYDTTGPNGGPGAVVATSNPLTGLVLGTNTFTFTTAPTLTPNTYYFLAFCSDAALANLPFNNTTFGAVNFPMPYATFPVANPALPTYPLGSAASCPGGVINLTAGNYSLVSEPQQDATTTYVYDNLPGDADFYGISGLPGTPASTVCTTVRGYFEKSDAGAKTGSIQLKSGATTVQATPIFLGTNWGWIWRTDANDPNTGAPWVSTAVNSVQIGPTVVS